MQRIVPLVSLLLLAACAPSGDAPSSTARPSTLDAPRDETAIEVALPDYVAVPGEKEFSGRLIARPLQPGALEPAGLQPAEVAARRLAARAELARHEIVEHVRQTDEFIVRVGDGRDNEVARALMATRLFQYVEPDWTVYPIACPNDTFFAGYQWHHQANRMQSCDAWNIHTGTPATGVGICDTGVLTTHEDLQLHRREGYNAVDRVWESNGGQIGPVHPHGTQTTGSAAANGNNGKGVAGVGWNLAHRMMRVSNLSTGSASISTLQHAARTSVESGDRVASVSYSGADSSSNLTTATYIKSIGGLLVWAAGNDNRNLTFGNRDNDDLIVVGATDQNDVKASFSAYGQFVDVVAPGVSIATSGSSNNANYVLVSGTSFACPLTAGLCALVWSVNPSLTPDQVEAILKQSTDDLGAAGTDNTYGHGRINSNKALIAATGGGTPPTADFIGTPTSGTAPLTVSFTDQSTGSPTSWSWNFGDGNTSTAQNPSHTYTAAGTYTVTLTATNGNGSNTRTRAGYISVTAPGNPPVAEFVGTPTSGTAPLAVSFTDQSTNSPTSWSWNFGDGDTSTAQNPSHTYTLAGAYTVTLTATNSAGSNTKVRTDYIVVSPGGYTGEGFKLSRNPDFSTEDQVFSRSDTIYILVWSDRVDFTNMRRNWWQLQTNRRDRTRQDLTNNQDRSFTASFQLGNLRSNATTWSFSALIEDRSRVSYRPSTTITVN